MGNPASLLEKGQAKLACKLNQDVEWTKGGGGEITLIEWACIFHKNENWYVNPLYVIMRLQPTQHQQVETAGPETTTAEKAVIQNWVFEDQCEGQNMKMWFDATAIIGVLTISHGSEILKCITGKLLAEDVASRYSFVCPLLKSSLKIKNSEKNIIWIFPLTMAADLFFSSESEPHGIETIQWPVTVKVHRPVTVMFQRPVTVTR